MVERIDFEGQRDRFAHDCSVLRTEAKVLQNRFTDPRMKDLVRTAVLNHIDDAEGIVLRGHGARDPYSVDYPLLQIGGRLFLDMAVKGLEYLKDIEKKYGADAQLIG